MSISTLFFFVLCGQISRNAFAAPIPSVSIDATRQTVKKGESISVTCSHPDAVRFFWLFRNDVITSVDVTLSGDKFQTLQILQVTESTVGSYSCHAINAAGDEIGSRTCTVSIVSSTSQTIKVIPKYQAKSIGTFTSFQCNSSNSNSQNQIYRWKLNDTTISTWNVQIRGLRFETILIRVGLDTIGKYTCYVESTNVEAVGNGYLSYLQITPKNQSVKVGGEANFNCYSPLASRYFWLLNGSSIRAISVRIDGDQRGMLRVMPVGVQTVGKYTCTATHNSGFALGVTHAFLSLSPTYKEITMTPKYLAARRNGMATFTCSAPGATEFIWQLDDVPILQSGIVISGLKRDKLTVIQVDSSTVGNYSCEAYDFVNFLGRTYGYLTFITVTPQTQFRPRNSLATFTCYAEGATSYFWELDGDLILSDEVDFSGEMNEILNIRSVTEDTIGNYTCSAHMDDSREIGVAWGILRMGSSTPILVQITPESQTAKRGGTATFTCSTSKSIEGTFIWLLDREPITSDDIVIEGANDQTLTVSYVSDETVGIYSCTAIDEDTTQVDTAYGVLSIGLGQEVPEEEGNVIVYPSSDVAVSGGRSLFQCASTISGQRTWTLNYRPLPKNVEYTGAGDYAIRIIGATKENDGDYYCSVTDRFGKVHSAFAKLIVVDHADMQHKSFKIIIMSIYTTKLISYM